MKPKPSILDHLIRFCLEQKIVVAIITAIAITWGIMVAPFNWNIADLPRDPVPVDAIPDIGENQQIVFTKWMGRSPQDIDDQVTYPLTVALLGIPNVKSVRSYSIFGISSIYVIFDEDVEFYWTRSRIIEKLNSLAPGTLPDGVAPALGPDATALGQVFWYTLEGRDKDGNPTGGWDLDELRSIQDWDVRYALMAADGVSEVASIGGFVKEYQVDIDPDAMRGYGVTLDQVFMAVRNSNVDVGARTIEISKAEYVIRGLGFLENLEDIELVAVASKDDTPVYIRDIAHVTYGPALRRGAIDKAGAEAVGGVVVVRYGDNPMRVIQNVKDKIKEISTGLPRKTLADGTESQVTIIPFYDRTGLINETLGTLNEALELEVLVVIIVVLLMVLHLRSSILISAMLPIAVLMAFIGMKVFKVDANIVALSGIVIAVGTIVEVGIVMCENILRRLTESDETENSLEVIYRASTEMGSAVFTAVLTTVIGFLPVFTLEAAEGKLFKPLAYTKTFALVASIIIALTIIPAMAHVLFTYKLPSKLLRTLAWSAFGIIGIIVLALGYTWPGIVILLFSIYWIIRPLLPALVAKIFEWSTNILAALIVLTTLTHAWEPLGAEIGFTKNLVFVSVLVLGLIGFFYLFQLVYKAFLRVALVINPLVPILVVVAAAVIAIFVWKGPKFYFGSLPAIPNAALIGGEDVVNELKQAGLIEQPADELLWPPSVISSKPEQFKQMIEATSIEDIQSVIDQWSTRHEFYTLKSKSWDEISHQSLGQKIKWLTASSWDGIGREFMPSLDEGSFLYMPTTSPHASIGESLDALQKMDMAIASIPEVDEVVGKIGRAESPLDPAPISMVETIVNYKSEYRVDENGRRMNFKFDESKNEFERDTNGELIPDKDGRAFRQWRDEIKSPQDIWNEIIRVAAVPGSTSAPKLQPIQTRIIMLQSGFRAPLGVKVYGPTLESIEQFGLDLERLLKEVPSIVANTVTADRIVGKPYLEIDIDRERIARYGISIRKVQDVIEVAIGGKTLTTTVEGRTRYPVRVRYMRELRDQYETLEEILVPAGGGRQIPLGELATINYLRGPQVIKSEDTFLVGYVIFDKKTGFAEVDVVEDASALVKNAIDSGRLKVPNGVTYRFAGSYENQVRANKKLLIVMPMALIFIFLILYFQFRSVITALIVFSGVILAFAGGFALIWFYNQEWFLDASMFNFLPSRPAALFADWWRGFESLIGTDMRTLMQIRPINLSVAVWVGFLALFGIATDNGVVLATLLDQEFQKNKPQSIKEIRIATVTAGKRRVRACLMTTATTVLALLPVLTSTGRGSDIMIPMAIPVFGGMVGALLTLFVVPTLYSFCREVAVYLRLNKPTPGISPTTGNSESGENS